MLQIDCTHYGYSAITVRWVPGAETAEVWTAHSGSCIDILAVPSQCTLAGLLGIVRRYCASGGANKGPCAGDAT